MVEFFVLDETGDRELEYEIDEYGEKSYSRIDKEQNAENGINNQDSKDNFQEPKKISKFTVYASIFKILQIFEGQFSVCKMTGYPEILTSTIVFFDDADNSIVLKGKSRIILKDDLIVFKKKSSNVLFAQPTLHSFASYEIYVCFKIKNNIINDNMRQILGCPFSSYIIFNDTKSNKIKGDGPWRILLNRDVIGDVHSAKEILKKFKFQVFTEIESGKTYYLSMEVENITEIISKVKFFQEKVITLLQVSKTISSIPYNFDEKFSGWGSTVFPFLSFVYGLSAIPQTSITGRIVHLPQSSGHGKTRLCFELLKYARTGVYCVYRSNTNNGFPKTTPWFGNLFSIFKKSNSDIDSLIYCALFILSCVGRFKKIEKAEFDKFEGKHSENPNEKEFDFSLGPEKTKDEFLTDILTDIRSKIGKEIFPIVFDECHEMLGTPESMPNSLNLYRTMRRLLFQLKDTKIVAIFLGTKSSLSDFILNYRRDPSIRDLVGDKEDYIDVPCYIYTQNVDSMFTQPRLITYSSCLSTINIGGTNISEPACLIEISRDFGRPLWTRYTFIYAINLALEKLKTEESLFELTCLILRTGSQVVSQDELAHKLVLSGMATLLNVDMDGSRCWVEYIPEPILSNAARIALTNINTLDKAIKEYLRRLEFGSFHDSGYSGELVARIILLRAMDLSVLKEQISNENLSKTDDIKVYTAETLFGESNFSLELGKNFLEKCRKIQEQNYVNVSGPASTSKSQSTSPSEIKSELPNAFSTKKRFLSPYIGTTTVRKYLMLLANLDDDSSLWKLGVSDEVLDGLVYFNQFIQTENPLIVNQQYLLHFFARSCAMILAKGAKGADLIIPVLRTDNCMSCIVIQVKNYGTETFPNKSAETSAKLTSEYLNFLNLGKIAGFDEVSPDDFVRVVIQFSEKGANDDNNDDDDDDDDDIAWIDIINSVSKATSIPEESDIRSSPRVNPKQKRKCQSLWLHGMSCFESSLFFRNGSIINNLNIIVNGQRGFLNGIQYPKKKLPTLLQTSMEGAKFLANSARTLANYDNIVIKDAQLRDKCDRKSVYEEYLQDLDTFTIPRFSLKHVEECTLTTLNEKLKKPKPKRQAANNSADDTFGDAPADVQEDLKKVLITVKFLNRHLLEPGSVAIDKTAVTYETEEEEDEEDDYDSKELVDDDAMEPVKDDYDAELAEDVKSPAPKRPKSQSKQ